MKSEKADLAADFPSGSADSVYLKTPFKTPSLKGGLGKGLPSTLKGEQFLAEWSLGRSVACLLHSDQL